ncbi:MAG: tRNA lysidine(34) synthetase TilS [Treponema sp.]|nr:tRNA lysidine(34) synthetase TilS [Treponema sp.]
MCSFVEDFDLKVKNELFNLGVNFSVHNRLGVAVSGGADSISLLTALLHVIPESVNIFVITVNHNLRQKEETEGDAEFVQEYCQRLNVPCERVDIPRGDIVQKSREQDIGIEAAARDARYCIFADFAMKYRVSHICLAHNKNDQVETILMRFFHGSGAESLSGIPPSRGIYIRPLLNVSRAEIEKYLECQNIPFCTDKTNFETIMYRNCIRNAIMPILNKEVAGWQKGVLSLSDKMRDDEFVLHDLAQKAFESECSLKEDCVVFDYKCFSKEPRAVQRRMMFMAFNAIHSSNRIPYRLVSDVMDHVSMFHNVWKEDSSGVSVQCNGTDIFVQKQKNIATESGFFVIIEQVGMYRTGNYVFEVSEENEFICIASENLSHLGETVCESSVSFENLGFPFVIRSRQPGDEIKNSLGNFTSVAKILNDWKCGSKKDCIPVIQRLTVAKQDLVCIWGEALGFKNWIVKDLK